VRVSPDEVLPSAAPLVPPDPEGGFPEDTFDPGGALGFGFGSEGFGVGFGVGFGGIFVCLVVVAITVVGAVEPDCTVLPGGSFSVVVVSWGDDNVYV
jgi:hypothetical protein